MGLDNWIVTESLFFYVIVRFVRFVSNPEVLERVYSLETEIIQIKEAIGIQNNSEMALTVVSKPGFLSSLFGVWSIENLTLDCINRLKAIYEQKDQKVRKVCYNHAKVL